MTDTMRQQAGSGGDGPMTAEQRSQLQTLCEAAREPFDGSLTRAAAARRIDELLARAGRASPAAGTPGDAAQAPPGENPAQSLGRAVGEVVLGSEPAPGGNTGGARGGL